MRARSIPLILAIALGGAAFTARADVVAFDSFEGYAVGQQLESGPDGVDGTGLNGGSGFTDAYNIDNALKSKVTVQAIALSKAVGSYTVDGGVNTVQYIPGADTNNLISRPLPTQSSTFYFSFLLRTSNPLDNEDFLQIGFSDVATGEPKVTVGAAGTAAGTAPSYYMVRVGGGASNQALNTSSALQPDITHLMVAKVTKTTGSSTFNRVDLIVDPTDLTEPTTWTVSKQVTAGGGGPASVSNFIVRTYRMESTDEYLFDRFVVADTFDGAIQAPEPSMLLLGALGLLITRRPRRAMLAHS